MDRITSERPDFKEEYIAPMVIIGYLDDLKNMKLIENSIKMTPTGKSVKAICEEFEWKPTDDELIGFVKEMVEENLKPMFLFLLLKYRDHREKMFEEVDFLKNGGNV